jgi:tRNA(fMet)-specific endonuclease VapC
MTLVLDTNRYSDADKGLPDVVRLLTLATQICVPTIVLGELRAGFLHGSKAAENDQRLLKFISSPRVRILVVDEATTQEYATLALHLRRAGKMIPTNDVWIAALTIQHGLSLYTRDGHFDLLPQLARI